jgi:hypothetical protein
MSDKPLRIRGVAMCTGMSRNLNIYTSEELQNFSSKLTNAPVYIEHVAVPNAVGKVTKTDWDGHNLWYEAEIYDAQTAEKIRKGLVQHVSVGADYEAVDVVDGKVPHGLHNAELSLVAVPGIPETNVQVLEHLATGKNSVIRLEEKDLTLIAEKIAAKTSEKDASAIEKLKTEVSQAKTNLSEVEGKCKIAESARDEAKNQLATANKTIEDLRKQLPGVGLLTNPPVMMPLSEHINSLEKLLPSQMVQRSSLGIQRLCQEIKSEIFKAKKQLDGA